MMDAGALCEKLREIRKQRGISGPALAERLGMNQGNFSRLERGMYEPRMSTLNSWAAALGVDLEIQVVRLE